MVSSLHWTRPARALLLTAAVALAALAAGALGRPSSTPVEPVPEAAVQQPPAPLPREWVWRKKAVTFDHMYRSRR